MITSLVYLLVYLMLLLNFIGVMPERGLLR
jgi:hypothetical protein